MGNKPTKPVSDYEVKVYRDGKSTYLEPRPTTPPFCQDVMESSRATALHTFGNRLTFTQKSGIPAMKVCVYDDSSCRDSHLTAEILEPMEWKVSDRDDMYGKAGLPQTTVWMHAHDIQSIRVIPKDTSCFRDAGLYNYKTLNNPKFSLMRKNYWKYLMVADRHIIENENGLPNWKDSASEFTYYWIPPAAGLQQPN